MDLLVTVLTVVATTIVTVVLPFAVRSFREFVTTLLSSLIKSSFDQKLERLKSDLRKAEEHFSSELRSNAQRVTALGDVTLSIRSSREQALDARRLKAVDVLWQAKIDADRFIVAAKLVSALNLQAMRELANTDQSVAKFAAKLEELSGSNLTKDSPLKTAATERPFLPPEVWLLFSAYQSILTTSVLYLKAFAVGGAYALKDEDLLKPMMLQALPEYADYIEKYGFGGYFRLLDVLEVKLLRSLGHVLSGHEQDEATLKRSAELLASVSTMDQGTVPPIPPTLRAPDIPEPPTPSLPRS